MKKRNQAGNWLAMAVLASTWGCGANDPGAEDEAEHLGSSSEALAANGSGTTYAEQCLANGVPIPPKFGTSTVLSPGVYEYGKWTKQSDSHIQFTDFAQARVYTTASIVPGQEGLCVIAAHYDEGPSSFDVICQGKNGKACFWESFSAPYDPPATPIYITSMDSGTALASNGHDVCTKCHAGRNAFITHFGTTDGLNGQNDPWGMHDQWMPTSSSWYTPIVPAGWLENPGPSNTGYPSTCTSCHSAGGAAGPFPTLRTPDFAGEKYCKILDRVVRSPAAEGGMPPSTPCSSRDAANCPANTDPQVQAMLAACGKAQPAQAVSYKSSPVAVTGYSSVAPYSGSWDHVLAGTDVYGTNKMYLFDNLFTYTASGGYMNGWSQIDYTSSLKSYYRPTLWTRDGNGSKLSIASTDYSGQIWERQFGTGGGLRSVNSSVMAAGSPFGYVRYDGYNTVVYRGTDNYIYESYWSGSAWYTNLIPGQVLAATGDPVAYNRGSSSSIIYKCSDLLCELRLVGSTWSFRTIRTSAPLKGSTMPAPFKRPWSSDYVIFYAGENGLHAIVDSTEPSFGPVDDYLIYGGLITSAPAPYGAQDSGIRVAFIADQGSGGSSYLKEAVLPYGNAPSSVSSWVVYDRFSTNNNVQQLSGDPGAYLSSLNRNTLLFRNTANTLYQLQTNNSSMGEVPYTKTTIQKGYIQDTSGSLTVGQEQSWSFWLPAGTYKLDLTPSSGDADLYVMRGGTPTTTSYDCRPYLGGTSPETCTSTIPGPGYGYINVMVRGYTASSYALRGYFND